MHICGCRCNEGLKVKTDESMRLAYTGLRGNSTPKDRDDHCVFICSRISYEVLFQLKFKFIMKR